MSGKLKAGLIDPIKWPGLHLPEGGPEPPPPGQEIWAFLHVTSSPMTDIPWGSNPELRNLGPSPSGFIVSRTELTGKGGLFSFHLGWVAQVMNLFLFFLQALVSCLLPCECGTHHCGGQDSPLTGKEGWGKLGCQ